MYKKMNRKGFTMVELLGVIVILGILSVISIVAIQGVLEKARKEYYKTQKNNMIMSTESYLNSNKNLLPKVSGQIIKVELGTLENNKFIDKVVDYNKNDCDSTNSYVQVFKYRDEINYTSYLKCPSYNDDNDLKQATPKINANFVTDLSKASVTITVSGGKNGSENIGLASYQYKIYKNGKLEYTSDIIDGDKTLSSKTSKVSLVKYVPGAIKIVVNAININGYSETKSFSPDGFIDNTPPYCEQIKGQSTVWTTGKRTITVDCKDDESGCKQETYTQEFTEEATTAEIDLENNSGTPGKCKVNIYIDKYAPKVTLKAYKRKADGTKDSSQLVGTITTDDVPYSTKNFKIDQNVVNGWLNNTNYPYGVYFEASYSDKNNIESISWSWNNGGLLSTDSNVKTFIGNDTKNPNKTNGNYSFSLSGEGYRYGELKIKDVAGHYSLIKITAPIDRTAPNTPSVGLYKWINNSTTPSKPDGLNPYTENSWSDLKVFTIPSSSDSLSGLDKYRYTTTGATGNNSDKQANYYNVTSEGTSTIKYKACDKAGNCSGYTDNRNIKIDISGPKISIKAYERTSSGGKSSTQLASEYTTSQDTMKSYKYTWSSNGWVTHKYGIYYDVELTDSSGLKTFKWEWNTGGLKENDPNVSKYTGSSSDNNLSGTKVNKNFSLSGEGYRKGKVTATDASGHTTIMYIEAPLDRTVPKAGKITGQGDDNHWTDKDRTINVVCTDNASGCDNPTKKTFTNSSSRSTMFVEDYAGNRAESFWVDVYIDKDAPYTPVYTKFKATANAKFGKEDCTSKSETSTTDINCSVEFKVKKGKQIKNTGWEAKRALRDMGCGVKKEQVKATCDNGNVYSSWTTVSGSYKTLLKNGAKKCTIKWRTYDCLNHKSPTLTVNVKIGTY